MEFHEWRYDGYELIPNEGGFYILYLNKDLPKLYKNDPKGILYIGETANLNRRLKIVKNKDDWKKDYEKNVNEMFDHSTLTYVVDFGENHRLVPHKPQIDNGLLQEEDSFFLKFIVSDSHDKDEKKLLNGHLMLFGQLPPFNNHGASLKSVWNEESENWDDAINFLNEVCGYL